MTQPEASTALPGALLATLQQRLAELPEVLSFEQVFTQARALLEALTVPAEVYTEFSDNTVRYYRREGVVSPPAGHGRGTSWSRVHVLQASSARVAGYLRISTTEALPKLFRDMDETALEAYLAVLAARAIEQDAAVARSMARVAHAVDATGPLPRAAFASSGTVWPLAARRSGRAQSAAPSSHAAPAAPLAPPPVAEVSFPLPGGGRLTLPAQHWAVLRGGDDAHEVIEAVRRALLA